MDSNLLLLSARKGLDVFNGVESLALRRVRFLTTPQVVSELRRLSSKRGSRIGREAELALHLAGRCVMVEPEAEAGDDADASLLWAARKYSAAVATADSGLRRRLRMSRIPVISLRGGRLYCEPESPELWFSGRA
ncbi:MAG: hypothetical protein QW390_01160 [Candidatus Bathyarchaeia archaeon]